MPAQFYVSCAQLKVTGGGSAVPTGILLPSGYPTNHPGINLNIYYPVLTSYTMPGPAVSYPVFQDRMSKLNLYRSGLVKSFIFGVGKWEPVLLVVEYRLLAISLFLDGLGFVVVHTIQKITLAVVCVNQLHVHCIMAWTNLNLVHGKSLRI